MKPINHKIVKVAAAMLACVMFSFAPLAQPAQSQPAQTLPESGAAPFDHSKTGFVLRDVHTTLRCEQCHVDGIFKNTPRDCSGCHSIGSRVGATPKPVNHVQTNKACDTCHVSATSFLVKNFKHVGITSGCASCHNGQSLGVVSKPAKHFPTLLPCENCHANTNTFTSWKMDHTGVTSGCSSCHGGQFVGVVSKPTMHIATTAPCETCHAGTVTFLGATYDHIGVAAGSCVTCHNGSLPGVMGQPANHIATNGTTCDVCHTQANTSNYTTFLGAVYNHAGAAGKCSSCHNGSYPGVLGQPANHIPVTGQCDNCHTQANTNNYLSFAGLKYHQAGMAAGTCSTCHTGSYPGALAKPAVHIPTTAACDACHTQANTSNYTTFVGSFYDHANPASAGACSTCHTGAYANVLGKPAVHIPTTAACDACHTQANTGNYQSFLGSFYDHANPASAGVCSTCHTGVYTNVLGKSANHITTTLQCDTCHTQANTSNFTTFLGATYSHTGVVAGSCATCHDGVHATGKPAIHITTTQACDQCHTQTNTSNYTTFLGAANPHQTTTVIGVCSTCHNGTQAVGQPANHIPTYGAACDTCHTPSNTSNFKTFLGATYSHTAVVAGSCANCHNGSYPGVLGKPVAHIPTTAPCDVCHTQTNTSNYTTFVGSFYDHANPASAGICSTCHTGVYANVLGKPAVHIPTTAQCDACHTQTNTGNYTSFLGSFYGHANSVSAGVCSTCHTGVYANVQGKPVNHIPVTAQCDTCHTQTNTSSYTTFLGVTYHLAVVPPGVCSTCHNGSYAGALGKPANHVVTTAECNTCHTQTNTGNYTSFLGAGYDHTGVVAGSCATCHNGIQATGKPANHIVTSAACDTCHTQANTSNYTTFLGASVAHTASMAGTCQTCHNGATAKGQPAGHIPTGTISCDGCHAMYNGTTVISFAPGTMNHLLVTATRCDTCHNGSYTTQGASGAQAKVTNHIPTTITGTLDCNTCHNITIAASIASMSWLTEKMNHNGAQGMGAPVYCVTCHLKGVTYLGSMQLMSHNGASVSKDCSSSSCHKPLNSKGPGTPYSKWN